MSGDPSGNRSREAGAWPERGDSAHALSSLGVPPPPGVHLEYVGPFRGAQWGGSVRDALGPVVSDLGGGVH